MNSRVKRFNNVYTEKSHRALKNNARFMRMLSASLRIKGEIAKKEFVNVLEGAAPVLCASPPVKARISSRLHTGKKVL
jgi:hypothetical protein